MTTPSPDTDFRASGPLRLPRRRWFAALRSVFAQIGQDNVNLVAGGVAFFGFLSVFPALVAMVSLVGLITDPTDIVDGVGVLAPVFPPGGLDLIRQELTRITSNTGQTLLLTTLFSTGLALWSANRGVKNFSFALTIVHGEDAQRGLIKLNAISLLLTLMLIGAGAAALAVIAVIPLALDLLALAKGTARTINVLQWVVLFSLIVGVTTVLLKVAPDRRDPTWRWAWPGALVGTILWIAVSVLFSYYVRNVANFSATYGSLATVTVVMLWSYMSAFIFLLGGELNAELEKQAVGDSTVGGVQKAGDRGAAPADTIPDLSS